MTVGCAMPHTGLARAFSGIVRAPMGASVTDPYGALAEAPARFDVELCATGTHPWSPWQEQSIIDTPHYRLVEESLRYVAWRNNTFGIHVHVGVRGHERAIDAANRLRSILPDLLALSASSPW